MRKEINHIYDIVDEEFLNHYNPRHRDFMKDFYYQNYLNYCNTLNITPFQQDICFKNARRRKIKLLQLCCPYCGNMSIIPTKSSICHLDKIKYCFNCGKSSAVINADFQISRIIRIAYFHAAGLEKLQSDMDKDKIEILSYDVYQLELVELASTLEVILRDFFESFVYINYMGAKNNYISDVISKNIGNDFMNIEKANNHYKKALKIDLRSLIDNNCWQDLLDIVNMRNTIVHNNGMPDQKFKKSNTFDRIKDCMKGDLIFLDVPKIKHYADRVIGVTNIIIELFDERYSTQKFNLIANHYFNNEE